MSNGFDLGDDDVICMPADYSFVKYPTAKINEIKRGLLADWIPQRARWFDDGIVCSVLRVQGGGWQKGKARFRLEFVPDEPEPLLDEPITQRTSISGLVSPLDDLRSDLNLTD